MNKIAPKAIKAKPYWFVGLVYQQKYKNIVSGHLSQNFGRFYRYYTCDNDWSPLNFYKNLNISIFFRLSKNILSTEQY